MISCRMIRQRQMVDCPSARGLGLRRGGGRCLKRGGGLRPNADWPLASGKRIFTFMPEANGRLPVGQPAASGSGEVESAASSEEEASGSSEAEASGRTPTDLLPPANAFSLSCQRQMVGCPSAGGLGLRRGGGHWLKRGGGLWPNAD